MSDTVTPVQISFTREAMEAATQELRAIESLYSVVAAWPWTPHAVALILIAVLFAALWRAHRNWKRDWLSGLIDARVASSRAARSKREQQKHPRLGTLIRSVPLYGYEGFDRLVEYCKRKLVADLLAISRPSFASFFVVTVAIVLFFAFARPPAWPIAQDWKSVGSALTDDLQHEGSDTLGLVVGAFAGLTLVVLALVVFVAESIRDDKDSERRRVLASIGWVWPLGLAVTLIPFGFLWSGARRLTILLEVIVATFTLIAFARVIRNLLDPDARSQNRATLLRKRVRSMLIDSVRERVGNSVLLDQLGSGKRIDAFHYTVSRSWIEDDAQGYAFIDAPQDGWLDDVHLGELENLGKRLDRYARRLGFALRETSVPERRSNVLGAVTEAPAQPAAPAPKAYLLKRYREEVPEDSIFYAKRRSLLAIPRALADSSAILSEIRAAIPHIFRFSKQEPSSLAIRREMQGAKDQLIRAIRDHALGAIDDLRQLYIQIAEEFLTILVEFGGGYSAQQAEKERGSFYESWSAIHWLQSDLRELISSAMEAGNVDVASTIAYLPFAIAARAVQVRDHYLFQQFLQFSSLLYILTSDRPAGSRMRSLLTERSWRWPKEIADFYVAPELDSKTASADELEQIRGFANFSLRVFQDLLKLVADKRDIATFEAVATEFGKLFATFRSETDRYEIPLLRVQLERAQSDLQRAELSRQLALQEKRVQIAKELDLAINEIRLAIGGRLLSERLDAPANVEVEKLFDLAKAMLPTDLAHLTLAFADASAWRTPDKWHWDEWDLVADGKAHWVDQHTKLNQMYAVRALELLAALSLETRANAELPPSHSLAEMARENNPQGLLPTLAKIEADAQQWRIVVNGDAVACIPVFRGLLAAAYASEQEREAERTRAAPMDASKLEEFRLEVIRAYNEGGHLRQIFVEVGVVEMHPDDHPGRSVASLGFNQLDDKNAFVEQEHTTYADWGRSYGQGLAHGEDDIVFAEMAKRAGTTVSFERTTAIAAIVKTLADMRLENPAILQSLAFTDENAEFRENPAFTPEYRSPANNVWRKINGFMGLLTIGARQVPVFDAFARLPDAQNKILVFDLHRYLRWHQFSPDDAPDERVDVHGSLLIRVFDLNSDEQKRSAIIAENPPWLAKQGDPVAYLRGRVLVNVFEKFRIDTPDPKTAVCLKLSRSSEGE